MNVLARARQVVSRIFARARTTPQPVYYDGRFLPVMQAGIVLTEDEALKVSAVFACVAVITDAICPAPWNVYRVDADGSEHLDRDPLRWMLNTRFSPEVPALAGREALLYGALIPGSGYAEIQRDRSNRPIALLNLESSRVSPRRDPETMELVYDVSQFTGGLVTIPASDMFHLRGRSLRSLLGDNTAFYASVAIATASAQQQYEAAYYQNSGNISGVLETPGTVTDDTITKMNKQWKARHSGRNQGLPLFLEKGMKYQKLNSDVQAAGLTEAEKASVQDIARFFGVPGHKLGLPEAAQGYGTNMESMERAFVNGTLGHWVAALEQEANYKLISERDTSRETRIDTSHLTRADFKTRMDGYAVAKKAGILSQNEIRAMERWNPAGAQGDLYTVESTMKTVDQLVNPPKPPAPQPPANGQDGAQDGQDLVNQAAAEMFAAEFERHLKRVANRRARKPITDEVLAEMRDKTFDDCRRAVAFASGALLRNVTRDDVRAIAAAVEQGEPPNLAALRLLEIQP